MALRSIHFIDLKVSTIGTEVDGRSVALASSVMQHWDTSPLNVQLFNFSGHFR